MIAVAGAPLDLALKSRVEQEFGLPLSNGYGITECSPGISGVRFDAPRADQAVGTLLPGVEARVRTIDGIPVARGEVGELHVRGRNVMRGYYREPDSPRKRSIARAGSTPAIWRASMAIACISSAAPRK